MENKINKISEERKIFEEKKVIISEEFEKFLFHLNSYCKGLNDFYKKYIKNTDKK